MARFELKLPKMGESVAEATITSWLKEVGEMVDMDDAVVEVATDKVDSEVPSEVEGKLIEILFDKDEVVKVGETIAIIETEGEEEESFEPEVTVVESVLEIEKTITSVREDITTPINTKSSERFYSPLVKKIAQTEGISIEELDIIKGTGKDDRVTKADILSYIETRGQHIQEKKAVVAPVVKKQEKNVKKEQVKEVEVKKTPIPMSVSGEDEIVEMSRMGKLIAKHMVESVQTSAHVQSFIEIDVTNIVTWRNKVKDEFYKREGEKLTFTPIFMQAVAQTLKQYPMVNISFDGERIIKRGNINLGMAAALPDGNLIVPVIKSNKKC